jgi:flagellar basal-body rod protein FlgF
MSAALARSVQIDAIADNLANADTPGFKGVRPTFSSFFPSGPSDKVLSGTVATNIDMRPGTTETTDTLTDAVPDGDAFFAVQMAGGKVGYTRNGHFLAGSDGVLRVAGMPVLGTNGEAITVPDGSDLTIEATGEVKVGQQVVGTLAQWGASGPMDRLGGSLMAPSAGTQMSQVTGTSLRVGELELGNVSALESTVALIGAQRNYELAMQAIQTYRQLDQTVVKAGLVR